MIITVSFTFGCLSDQRLRWHVGGWGQCHVIILQLFGVGNFHSLTLISFSAHHCWQPFEIGDDYCGQHDINHPIKGMEPVLGQSIISWNQVNVTSVAVTQTTDFTVAFLGTDDGFLKKVCVRVFRMTNCPLNCLEVDLRWPMLFYMFL